MQNKEKEYVQVFKIEEYTDFQSGFQDSQNKIIEKLMEKIAQISENKGYAIAQLENYQEEYFDLLDDYHNLVVERENATEIVIELLDAKIAEAKEYFLKKYALVLENIEWLSDCNQIYFGFSSVYFKNSFEEIEIQSVTLDYLLKNNVKDWKLNEVTSFLKNPFQNCELLID